MLVDNAKIRDISASALRDWNKEFRLLTNLFQRTWNKNNRRASLAQITRHVRKWGLKRTSNELEGAGDWRPQMNNCKRDQNANTNQKHVYP